MEEFLIKEFGEENGQILYEKVKEKLLELIKKNIVQSKVTMNLLKTSVLPRIALYKVLQEKIDNKKQCLDLVEKSFLEDLNKFVNANNKNQEEDNFFNKFSITFSSFLQSDSFESEIIVKNEKCLSITVTKCIYNDTCIKNGCNELCDMFCKGDYVCYGNFKNIEFKRDHTLGTDGKSCDFEFINKNRI